MKKIDNKNNNSNMLKEINTTYAIDTKTTTATTTRIITKKKN